MIPLGCFSNRTPQMKKTSRAQTKDLDTSYFPASLILCVQATTSSRLFSCSHENVKLGSKFHSVLLKAMKVTSATKPVNNCDNLYLK